MKTSSAKAKGRRLCQLVRDKFLEWAPDLKEDDIRVTPSGCTGEDLWLSPEAQKVYPFFVECKNQEKLNIWACMKQAEGHVLIDTERVPLLIFSRNHHDPYVTLSLENFLKLTR